MINNNEIIYKMNAVIEYLKNNGGYDYKLYNQLCPGMETRLKYCRICRRYSIHY